MNIVNELGVIVEVEPPPIPQVKCGICGNMTSVDRLFIQHNLKVSPQYFHICEECEDRCLRCTTGLERVRHPEKTT